ncbi:hypothetical protein JOD97_001679 [Duganella sp. 1411]|uniref:hypothetical protein n=1 Tax=Duganella sp. 1411 TaxID=2806572 RepID=UPI001AE452AA|nr:hypothetical protein [Duganella sp. 1411]MBP1203665.1 hypothetical protein [Duganella sp. 1411]
MDATKKPSRGVYFLANNKVYELAVAFLNSFRTHNRELDLCLIPYDQDVDRIIALKDTYAFSVFQDDHLLASCDAISEKFHGKRLGAYRKFVAWEGTFDEFIYIDLDTVVLDSVDFAYENLHRCDIYTSHSNIEAIRQWVWKDSIYEKNILAPEQIAFAANTGFFVSTRHLLNMGQIEAKVDAGLRLKDDMELKCMEQPFLNYLIVTSGHRYGSLLTFLVSGADPTVKLEMWAGNPGCIVGDGKLHMPNFPPIFLLHWAGIWQSDNGSLSEIPYKKLWDHYRNLSLSADVSS